MHDRSLRLVIHASTGRVAVRDLGGPQVGAEDLVPDVGRGYAFVQQC